MNQIEAQQIVASLQLKPPIGNNRTGLGLQIKGGRPAKITSVTKNENAWNAGIRTGDVIIKINGQTVSDLEHKEVIQKIKSNKERVVLTLLRMREDHHPNSNSSGFSTPHHQSNNSLNISQEFEEDPQSPNVRAKNKVQKAIILE